MEYQNFIKSSQIDITKASKFMKQYLEIKRQNPEFIIFFRLGDFYETYFEDANVLSKVCGVTLTKRKFTEIGDILMAGVPHSKAEIYISKLINEKYKVSIVEQVQDKEEVQKGDIIKREIIRTYSPGTLIEEGFLDGRKNNFLACVLKYGNIYGFSYSDISTGEFFITQGNFEEILCELSKINPSELLVKIKTRDIKTLKSIPDEQPDIEPEIWKNYPYTLVSGELFNLEFQNETLKSCEAGLLCANCILNYTKITQKKFMPKLDIIKKYNISSHLIMNAKTRENLELNRNSFDNKKTGSIFWAMDECKTFMGKRLLSCWINEPLYDVAKINERLDGVQELVLNPEKLNELTMVLEEVGDISRLSSKLSNCTITPKDLLNIKASLKITEKFDDICKCFNSPILKTSFEREILEDYRRIIERTILDEPSNNIRAGKIIKDGAHGILDNIRAQIFQIEKDLINYEKELINLSGIKNLKINYSKNIGYSIDVPSSGVKKFTDAIQKTIAKQKLATVEKFTTQKLSEMEEKILSLKMKACELEYDTFMKLKEYSKELTQPLRDFASEIAIKDVISSFASIALKNNYIRPKITDKFKYNVIKGFNPVLLKLLEKCDALDIDFNEDVQCKILTGANMSGKSTYLRELAALVIMTQCGSFVPCKYFEASLVDKIFARMGSFDETVNNNSAFMCEMLEVSEILNNATDKSLILLDETGKSTSYQDGVSISYGIIKFIAEKIKAKTILATHFHRLNILEQDTKGVLNYKFEINENSDGSISRRLVKGYLKDSFGFEIARKAKLPSEVLEHASAFNGSTNTCNNVF